MKGSILRIALTVFIVLLCAAPVTALAETQTDDCAAAAQAWYDAIDDETLAQTFTSAVTSPSAQDAVPFFNALMDIINLDAPACVEEARDRYLSGLAWLGDSVRAKLGGDTGNQMVFGFVAFQRVGEFRGQIAALGVQILILPNAELYFK